MPQGELKKALVSLRDGPDGRDMAVIHHLERDRYLELGSDRWGRQLLTRGWKEKRGAARHLYRELTIRKSKGSKGFRHLRDHIVRFPSAPIYGTNRKSDYGIEFPREATHTLRVLTRPGDERPVGRLFIFYNGLNEAENLRFYYRLADWILGEDSRKDDFRSACLIAPFPGHLTHSPLPGAFSQTPLLRYLSDSGELFRQFLRYMVEMRWLLSAISRESPREWMTGARMADGNLPKCVRGEAKDLLDASRGALELQKGEKLSRREAKDLGLPVTEATVESTTKALDSILTRPKGQRKGSLSIHVAGYSLGGFLAQTVFFSWPNMVSSCATICSGGAIRALSPTAFAHPEEWQAVLHTLRPELEESMLRKRIDHQDDRIAGIPEDLFPYYQRVFDQVFLQEDHASYKARLSEYGTRMLFIGGGEDPIVRPHEVLDAGPKEGITMLSVANLTHFLGEEARTAREIEQREFWLPEAGGLIARAARRAEELHQQERSLAEEMHLDAKEVEELSMKAKEEGPTAQEKERAKRKARRRERREKTGRSTSLKAPEGRDLESPGFEDALDWVIDGVSSRGKDKKGEGWLFVCRNGLPAAFLDPEMRRAWASGLRHNDVFVQTYAEGLTHRAAELRTIKDRTTLVLPYELEDTFVRLSGELIDPHSDAPGLLVTEARRRVAWETFLDVWGEQAAWFKPGLIAENLRSGLEASKFGEEVSGWQEVPPMHLTMTHVPDVWIAVDEGKAYHVSDGRDGAAQRLIDRVTNVIEDERKTLKEKKEAQKADLPLESPKSALSYEGEALEKDLEKGRIRMVSVSASELNPRYRGRFEQSFQRALVLLAHCAGALLRSVDSPAPPPSNRTRALN